MIEKLKIIFCSNICYWKVSWSEQPFRLLALLPVNWPPALSLYESLFETSETAFRHVGLYWTPCSSIDHTWRFINFTSLASLHENEGVFFTLIIVTSCEVEFTLNEKTTNLTPIWHFVSFSNFLLETFLPHLVTLTHPRLEILGKTQSEVIPISGFLVNLL